MSEVNVTVKIPHEVYVELLMAANEAGLSVSEFASSVVADYVEENYAQV
jgi:predicted HicB family RNase H-like nuclease